MESADIKEVLLAAIAAIAAVATTYFTLRYAITRGKDRASSNIRSSDSDNSN